MTATLSSKGQVVLNASLRRAFGLTPGMKFEIRGENGFIVLEPLRSPKPNVGEMIDKPFHIPDTAFASLSDKEIAEWGL